MTPVYKIFAAVVLFCFLFLHADAQQQSADTTADSSQRAAETYVIRQREQQKIDSIVIGQWQKELLLAGNDDKRKKDIEARLHELVEQDSAHRMAAIKKMNELRRTAKGYAVTLFADTLFIIYNRVGSFSAGERADAISERIRKLYDDAFFKPALLKVVSTENTWDIIYSSDNIIISISSMDALWHGQPAEDLAEHFLNAIQKSIAKEREANSFVNLLKTAGNIALIILGITIIIIVVNRLFRYSARMIVRKMDKAGYSKGSNLLAPATPYNFAMRLNNILRIVIIGLAIYLGLPLLFDKFPQTKPIGDMLMGWITTPAKGIFTGVVNFLPNLFTIVIIYVVTRLIVRLVKHLAYDVEKGALTLNGFYKEWAMPTFNIIRVIIYAFMLVIVWPYLPGSSSPAFKGVTVFVGLLISLGSSSAIANIVSGMVITYMRPFKKGDRVKIGDVVGDVVEKTMLVIRLRTIKNEDITIPNSTIMNNHTINYSANAEDGGLIIHSTVTIGYDVPWKDVHQALIDAALRCELILKEPSPYVLQTSLDDFYVSYQLNAHTKEANKQAAIYSALHQNLQDVCNERGIEIMSPHYSAMRDGNNTTIPHNYVPPGYKPPPFNVHVTGDK